MTREAGVRYLVACAGAIPQELRDRRADGGDLAAAVLRGCDDFARSAAEAATSALPLRSLFEDYERLSMAKAAALDAAASVARDYPNMADFWEDAARQERGESPWTYWDSYEHGARRRLESGVAAAYGAPEALLLNSGMAAIDAVLSGLELGPGDLAAAHSASYFETTDYLDGVLGVRGVKTHRFDLTDSEDVERLTQSDARVLVFEPVLNTVTADVTHALFAAASNLPSSMLVCLDSSMVGHSVTWPQWAELFGDERLMVVESGTKYLTRRCSAGVVYGRDLSAPRAYARRIGLNLQERAFNQISRGEVDRCADRVRLHDANARAFAAAVDTSRWAAVHHAGFSAGQIGAGSSVLFCAPHAGADAEQIPRFPGAWREAARSRGADVGVRAGFGWNTTSCRSYGADHLNQRSGSSFLRISVGLESEEELAALATAFDETANALFIPRPQR